MRAVAYDQRLDSSATDPGDAIDQIFFAGATLAYQFNPHISAVIR